MAEENSTKSKRKGVCALCLEEKELTEEHVIPYVLGGRYKWPGLCKSCNNKLGSDLDARFAQNAIVRLGRFFHKVKGRHGKLKSIFDGAEGTIGEFEIPFKGSKNGKPCMKPKVEVQFLDGNQMRVRAGFDPNMSREEVRDILIGKTVKAWEEHHPNATKEELAHVRDKIAKGLAEVPQGITTSDKVVLHEKCNPEIESLFFTRLAYILAVLAHGMDYAKKSQTAINLRKAIIDRDTSVPVRRCLLPDSPEVKGIVDSIDGHRYIFAILVKGWAIISIFGYIAIIQYEAADTRFMFMDSEPYLMRFSFDKKTIEEEGSFSQGPLKEYLDKHLNAMKAALAKHDPEMLTEFIKSSN